LSDIRLAEINARLKNESIRGDVTRRVRGLIVFTGGLILMVMGLGMWRSPEIDWEGFLAAGSLIISDIARLIHDPFAVLGVIVLIIGLIIAYNGLRRLVRR